jgi:hypothetical protein
VQQTPVSFGGAEAVGDYQPPLPLQRRGIAQNIASNFGEYAPKIVSRFKELPLLKGYCRGETLFAPTSLQKNAYSSVML